MGLKFGHPIGASGLRMLYENYLQLQASGARQLSDPKLGLNHTRGLPPPKHLLHFNCWTLRPGRKRLNQQQPNLINSVPSQSENFDLARQALSQAKSVLNDAIGVCATRCTCCRLTRRCFKMRSKTATTSPC